MHFVNMICISFPVKKMERSLNDRGKKYIAYYLGLYMDLKHHRVEVTTYINMIRTKQIWKVLYVFMLVVVIRLHKVTDVYSSNTRNQNFGSMYFTLTNIYKSFFSLLWQWNSDNVLNCNISFFLQNTASRYIKRLWHHIPYKS